MIYDFHAGYSLVLKPGVTQQEGIDFLTGEVLQPPKKWEDLSDVDDQAARLHLAMQAVLTPYKDYARVGRRGKPAGLLHAVTSGKLNEYFELQNRIFLTPLNLYPDLPDLTLLPSGTWSIYFKFNLHKPYISRDDTDFYIIDNPVKKEWVFKLPYIAPGQWKGALRAAMVKQLADAAGSISDEEFADRRFYQSLLFGDEKGEEQNAIKGLAEYLDNIKPDAPDAAPLYREKIRRYFSIKDEDPLPHHTGCLYFYPTYFIKIALDVINPHDRETGTGSQPIYFETVPSGAEGTFTLLYVPFYQTGKEQDEKAVTADISLVAEGIRAMMLQYGFGAKTLSGHGTAKPELEDGQVILKALDMDTDKKEESKPQQPEEVFLKYLNEDGSVKEEFRGSGEAGLLSNSEYGERVHQSDGGSQAEFKSFRRWYKESGEHWQNFIQNQEAPASKIPTWTFKNFDELVELAEQIEKSLNPQERAK